MYRGRRQGVRRRLTVKRLKHHPLLRGRGHYKGLKNDVWGLGPGNPRGRSDISIFRPGHSDAGVWCCEHQTPVVREMSCTGAAGGARGRLNVEDPSYRRGSRKPTYTFQTSDRVIARNTIHPRFRIQHDEKFPADESRISFRPVTQQNTS
jgi:hypothetical protein